MKIYLHTIRYGVEANFEYHGNEHFYDSNNGMLTIYSPIEESETVDEDGTPHKVSTVAMVAYVTICAGDRVLVTPCGPECEEHHFRETAQTKYTGPYSEFAKVFPGLAKMSQETETEIKALSLKEPASDPLH